MTVAAFDPFVATARWVCWRLERRRGTLAKVPYCPTGGLAKADDPRTWDTRAAAEARAVTLVNGSGGGVGIVLGDLGDGTSLGGIDLDTCRASDGTLEPWAIEIIEKIGSYTEVSPSLTGAKIFLNASVMAGRRCSPTRVRHAADSLTPYLMKVTSSAGVPPTTNIHRHPYFAPTT